MNKRLISFKNSSKEVQRGIIGFAFVLPAILTMVLMIVYPMLYGAYISFFNTNLVNKWNFVGLKYYIQAFTDSTFYTSVGRTAIFMICVVAGHFLLGFVLSNLLNKEFKGRTIYRALFMLPWLFPESVIALLFTWILNPMYGVFNDILKSLGIIESNIAWLGSKELAFPTVILTCIWKGYPLVMTMILSAMQSISHDLYEAAELDGANKWKQFLHVTLPGIRPVVLTTFILDSVWWFKQYTLVYTMTGGGPGTATDLVSLTIYKSAFNDLRFGKASAWGIIVFILCYLISKIYGRIFNDND